jgi:hypothetical protein
MIIWIRLSQDAEEYLPLKLRLILKLSNFTSIISLKFNFFRYCFFIFIIMVVFAALQLVNQGFLF